MDSKTQINNHNAHCWSNDYHELISQFYFQVVRNNKKDKFDICKSKLNQLLSLFSQKNDFNKYTYYSYLLTLYLIIGNTRDILCGKGERDLSYLMLCIWYDYFPELAKNALKSFVLIDDGQIHPYGSWKDIKYFSQFAMTYYKSKKHPFIKYAFSLLINQLNLDIMELKYLEHNPDKQSSISLAAKWCPREKSKFSWMYYKLANMWSNNNPKSNNDWKKTNKQFRLILSKLNHKLNTLEILQCNNEWSDIDYNLVCSHSLLKYSNAFMNIDKDGLQKSSSPERIISSNKFIKHINDVIEKPILYKINSKRLYPYQIVKDVLRNYGSIYINSTNKTLTQYINLIQLQWNNIVKQNKNISRFIPMADLSTMLSNSEALNNSIALSILISEITHSAFRNRIITFTQTPEWINLDKCNNIIDKIIKTAYSKCETKANIYNALEFILETIQKFNIDPEEVENMGLIIFSNMQFEMHNTYKENPLYDNIVQLYQNAGLNSKFKKPYNPPHIVFWNLEQTNNFPCTSRTKNITMLSGYSPLLLNEFCYKGLDGLKELTPYKMIQDILNNNRYTYLKKIFSKEISI